VSGGTPLNLQGGGSSTAAGSAVNDRSVSRLKVGINRAILPKTPLSERLSNDSEN
jgi:hypothetical protein